MDTKRSPDKLSPGHLSHTLDMLPAEPLWKRVPCRDEKGKPLSDFMMLIPGLKKKSPVSKRQVIDKIEKVLMVYQQDVFFADLNLQLNILWVSIRQRHGAGVELAAAIHALVPEARLIAERFD